MNRILLITLFLSTLSAMAQKSPDDYPNLTDFDYSGIMGFDPNTHVGNRELHTRRLGTTSPRFGLSLKWFGVSGYELSDNETTILIDPFVSRPRLRNVVFGTITADSIAIEKYILEPLKNKMDKVKAILVAHDHHDHVMDVPYIISKYKNPSDRPTIVGSPNTLDLLNSYGHPDHSRFRRNDILNYYRNIPRKYNLQDQIGYDENNTPFYSRPDDFSFALAATPVISLEFPDEGPVFVDKTMQIQEVGQFGNFKVTGIISKHIGYDPIPLSIVDDIGDDVLAPHHSLSYKSFNNTSVAYLVEHVSGLRILFSDPAKYYYPQEMHERIGKIDILIQTIAGRHANDGIAETMATLQPKIVIPSHYDNFFTPLPDMKKLKTNLRILFWEYSQYDKFFEDFKWDADSDSFDDNVSYVEEANYLIHTKKYGFGAKPPLPIYNPELKTMRLFHYYSLDHIK